MLQVLYFDTFSAFGDRVGLHEEWLSRLGRNDVSLESLQQCASKVHPILCMFNHIDLQPNLLSLDTFHSFTQQPIISVTIDPDMDLNFLPLLFGKKQRLTIQRSPLYHIHELGLSSSLLYLRISDCRLRDLFGLASAVALRMAVFDRNLIVDVSGVAVLDSLAAIDLTDNQIAEVSQLQSFRGKALGGVCLKGNPVTNSFQYQQYVAKNHRFALLLYGFQIYSGYSGQGRQCKTVVDGQKKEVSEIMCQEECGYEEQEAFFRQEALQMQLQFSILQQNRLKQLKIGNPTKPQKQFKSQQHQLHEYYPLDLRDFQTEDREPAEQLLQVYRRPALQQDYQLQQVFLKDQSIGHDRLGMVQEKANIERSQLDRFIKSFVIKHKSQFTLPSYTVNPKSITVKPSSAKIVRRPNSAQPHKKPSERGRSARPALKHSTVFSPGRQQPVFIDKSDKKKTAVIQKKSILERKRMQRELESGIAGIRGKGGLFF